MQSKKEDFLAVPKLGGLFEYFLIAVKSCCVSSKIKLPNTVKVF